MTSNNIDVLNTIRKSIQKESLSWVEVSDDAVSVVFDKVRLLIPQSNKYDLRFKISGPETE